jgi:hypothetical protein
MHENSFAHRMRAEGDLLFICMKTSTHMTYVMQRRIQQLEKGLTEGITENQAHVHPRSRNEASTSSKQEEMSFAAILQQVQRERN